MNHQDMILDMMYSWDNMHLQDMHALMQSSLDKIGQIRKLCSLQTGFCYMQDYMSQKDKLLCHDLKNYNNPLEYLNILFYQFHSDIFQARIVLANLWQLDIYVQFDRFHGLS